MLIIFFMGGVTAQNWLIKQYGITINVMVLTGLAFFVAWLIGTIMVKSGIIKAEQTFYAEQNGVLDELRKNKELK